MLAMSSYIISFRGLIHANSSILLLSHFTFSVQKLSNFSLPSNMNSSSDDSLGDPDDIAIQSAQMIEATKTLTDA